MAHKALFEGLIVDELDRSVPVAMVGDEPCYVVDDNGFKRHIPSEQVDRQILEMMQSQVKGNEHLIGEQTAKMLGQDDLFTVALIQNQLKNLDRQFDNLLDTGIPEEGRTYLGMMGFKVVINLHGEVVRVEQPSTSSGEEGGED